MRALPGRQRVQAEVGDGWGSRSDEHEGVTAAGSLGRPRIEVSCSIDVVFVCPSDTGWRLRRWGTSRHLYASSLSSQRCVTGVYKLAGGVGSRELVSTLFSCDLCAREVGLRSCTILHVAGVFCEMQPMPLNALE